MEVVFVLFACNCCCVLVCCVLVFFVLVFCVFVCCVLVCCIETVLLLTLSSCKVVRCRHIFIKSSLCFFLFFLKLVAFSVKLSVELESSVLMTSHERCAGMLRLT